MLLVRHSQAIGAALHSSLATEAHPLHIVAVVCLLKIFQDAEEQGKGREEPEAGEE